MMDAFEFSVFAVLLFPLSLSSLVICKELSSIANSLRSIKISMASAIEECDDDDE